MPSFTFSSTATAFVLRGARPVFVDVRPDTLNLDEAQVEGAIAPATKAIVPVHYAGVGCDMDALVSIARSRGLLIVEDAAQALLASYKGTALGGIGDLGALSFHETKNVTCGEGGALLVNGEGWIERAEIIYEKGTDRSRFFRGQVDRYTWVDIGSSYPLSEINAAFLWAQLENAEAITASRKRLWSRYHEGFADLERRGEIRRPIIPPECEHNGHIYYLLLPEGASRDAFIAHLEKFGVRSVFHYVPLHDSPAGRRYGRSHGSLAVTASISERLVRLPLWAKLDLASVDRVVEAVYAASRSLRVGS